MVPEVVTVPDREDSAAYRPRRSVLYLPASNERALEKAKTLAVDALILDLEDAVAPDAKPDARDKACAAASSGDYGRREVTIRVNGMDTEWHAADVEAACKAGPDAILVPKVGSADAVLELVESLGRHGAPESTQLWAMIETPRAMLHAEEIAAASDRLAVLVMGTNDLAKELHAEHVPGRQLLVTGLGLCLLAARATGTVILDGVYNNVKDAEGFEAECLQGRQMGFDGKTLIHPSQVEPCNEVFAPTEADVEYAGRVIAAFEEAEAAGKGVVTVDGRMIENLHVENARRTLAISDAIAKLQHQALSRGDTDPRFHALTRPEPVEAEATNRAIRLAEVAGAPILVVHVSCAPALEAIHLAHERGQTVYAETCPQYFAFEYEDLAREGFEGAKYVCSTPLRPKEHQAALWRGLRTDDLSVVSTDHCPFCFKGQKEMGLGDFSKIPNGLPSVEHRMDLLHTGVVEGHISRRRWVEIACATPARMFGLYPRKGTIAPGSDADVVIYDPNATQTLSASTHHMAVDYSCYEGKQLTGRVDTVLSRGRVIIDGGEYLGEAGHGRYLRRDTCQYLR